MQKSADQIFAEVFNAAIPNNTYEGNISTQYEVGVLYPVGVVINLTVDMITVDENPLVAEQRDGFGGGFDSVALPRESAGKAYIDMYTLEPFNQPDGSGVHWYMYDQDFPIDFIRDFQKLILYSTGNIFSEATRYFVPPPPPPAKRSAKRGLDHVDVSEEEHGKMQDLARSYHAYLRQNDLSWCIAEGCMKSLSH
jgi:hypothetical protein